MSRSTDAKGGLTRRSALKAGGALAAAATVFSPAILRAAPATIRFANGGAVAPNEIETLMTTEFFQKNVLKNYGKVYELQATFTRGTPEAAALMAAGRVDLACLSFPIFAASVLKDAVPGGMSIIADVFQDGRKGYASNTFFVLDNGGPKTVKDLKGKKIAINAFSSAVDLELRVVLKKNGLDPKKDVEIVEVTFPNMGPALREKRVDCAVMVLPFMAVEVAKGGFAAGVTAEKFRPHVILLDMHLRDIDAPQVAKHVKQNADLQLTKVIAMSGKMTDDESKGLVATGFDGFLKKPFHVRQVIEAIEDSMAVVY